MFPDTSPRNIDGGIPQIGGDEAWKIGYGAGCYVNASAEPWSKNFNMYTYITKELPAIVEKYFHVASDRRSILGHSMGGNGALMMAARNPEMYKSVSAFAPICNQSSEQSKFCKMAMDNYFAGKPELAKTFDCSEVIRSAKSIPVGLVDMGTHDNFKEDLSAQTLINALGNGGHKNVTFRWQEGYGHGFDFVSTFIEEHIAFHAHHLHK